MDTSGFYKLENENLVHGPNFVLNASYELRRETKDSQTYPVDGWSWFDSVEAARTAFNLPEPQPEPEQESARPIPGHAKEGARRLPSRESLRKRS